MADVFLFIVLFACIANRTVAFYDMDYDKGSWSNSSGRLSVLMQGLPLRCNIFQSFTSGVKIPAWIDSHKMVASYSLTILSAYSYRGDNESFSISCGNMLDTLNWMIQLSLYNWVLIEYNKMKMTTVENRSHLALIQAIWCVSWDVFCILQLSDNKPTLCHNILWISLSVN